VNGTNWQIEHGCPQCGAPVTLDETDRLLACPFCRTRLYIVPHGPICYRIPPAARGEGELIYLPYWRLRGSSFSVQASEITHRFVDTNALAVHLPEMPASLGLRPQVLKLRFIAPNTEGRFITPNLTLQQAIPDLGATPPGIFHRVFIGEAVSLIHAPSFLRNDTLYDAVLGRPVCACNRDLRETLTRAAAPPGQVRFVATLCPHCSWDMEGEKDSLVLVCRNCDSAWHCPEDEFLRLEFAVLKPPTADTKIALYLPFWRMKPRIEGLELASWADLIRLANLPKAVTPAFEEAPLVLWSPAFKVNPALYSRWARQMTVFRPLGEAIDRFSDLPLYPVTLPLSEAAEGICVTLAQMIADKRRLYPKLAGLHVTLEEYRLEYHPFLLDRNELLHASMRVALDRTALSHGIRM
jgi:DNA-directed RNA polymerase subunit RPC12/RpoP